MKKAKYFVIEGTEGVGKTTQVAALIKHLLSKKFKVLETKEPGTPHLPITGELRKIMLDNEYDKHLSQTSREFISQASRSIHLESLIKPSLKNYDFIIQDRGILSSLAYGKACKNKVKFLKKISNYVVNHSGICKKYHNLYDHIIILQGNPVKNLSRAKKAKKEFKKGDAMESRGNAFMQEVGSNLVKYSKKFKKVTIINVDGKSIEQVSKLIQKALKV